MAQISKIEWTDSTWNPLTGCTKISIGCKNCYAERLSIRLQAIGNPSYANGFRLTLHEDLLEAPLKWRKPRNIFVNSMSDLFHEAVPEEFILEVFRVMKESFWHRFQLLTKRSERLVVMGNEIEWPPNVWMGVTVESPEYKFRIDDLRKTQAKIKFISFEPLLDAISNLELDGISWAIVGGESGPGARGMKPEWVTEIRDVCARDRVPFFFKQWGGVNKKKNGRSLEGRTWDEMPPTNSILSDNPQ